MRDLGRPGRAKPHTEIHLESLASGGGVGSCDVIHIVPYITSANIHHHVFWFAALRATPEQKLQFQEKHLSNNNPQQIMPRKRLVCTNPQ